MNRCASFLFFIVFSLPLALRADPSARINQSGVLIVAIGERRDINEMAIYPPDGLKNRPLLIAAHGGGCSGPREIGAWLDLAKIHNFTVICPTFLSAKNNSMYVPMDVPYFDDCLHWIEEHLEYDKSRAYMTGFSGGGYPTWYLATRHPEFFNGIFLQSGNFAGDNYNLNLAEWKNKPIKLIWGTEDSPTVAAQNKQALKLLQTKNLANISFEIIPGAHHQPHRNRVISWMESL